VKELEKVIDDESQTIRETEFNVPGRYAVVNVICNSCMYPMEAMVDRMNRIYLPSRFSKETIKRIVVDGKPMKITEIDARYEDDVVAHVVCQLEEESDENRGDH
jgi:hypothetical protein